MRPNSPATNHDSLSGYNALSFRATVVAALLIESFVCRVKVSVVVGKGGGARSNIPKLVTSTSIASPEPENSEVDSREVETSAPASDGSLMADVLFVC